MIQANKIGGVNYTASALYDGNNAAWWDFTDVTTITKDVNNLVSAVADKSGNGRTLTQGTLGSRPYWTPQETIFNNKSLSTVSFALNQPNTIYAVIKVNYDTDPALNYLIKGLNSVSIINFGGYSSGFISTYAGNSMYGSNIIGGHYYIMRIILSGDNSNIKLDDNVYSGALGSTNLGGIILGNSIYSVFNIKELIVRNGVDTITDEIDIYNYLRLKHLTPAKPTTLDLGQVAYYALNGNTKDDAGYNNPGTVAGAALQTIDKDGYSNSAYNFNGGLTQWINCGNNPIIHVGLTGEMSVSCWVRSLDNNAVDKAIVSNGNYGGWEQGWILGKRSTNKFAFSFDENSGPASGYYRGYNSGVISNLTYTDTSWHHLCAVKRFEGGIYKLILYVDGVRQSATKSNPSIGSNPGWGLVIGAGSYDYPDRSGALWNGDIDEVRVHNRSLTDSEILYLSKVNRPVQLQTNIELGFDAFAAPSAWTSSDQYATYGNEVNIHKIFCAYNNPNKSYIYSVDSSYDLLTLPAIAGVTYRVGHNGSGVPRFNDMASSASNPFVGGGPVTTHRYVIVCGDVSYAYLPIGSVWAYFGPKISSIAHTWTGAAAYLKYIHFANINSLISLPGGAFGGSLLTGAITLPNSLTIIPSQAFQGCQYLVSIHIGNAVTSIGQWALWGSNNIIGTLTLPDSLVTIAANSLTSPFTGKLTIPSSVKSIGGSAFGNGFTSLEIKEGINTIGDNAFANMSNLKGPLIIPNTVTSIGSSTFQNCIGFTSLSLGNSVTSIGGQTFQGCSGFRGDLILPNSLISIGISSFVSTLFDTLSIGTGGITLGNVSLGYCTNYKGDLVIPGNVIFSGGWFFVSNIFTGNLVLNEGLTTTGYQSFNNATFNGTMTLPSTLTLLDVGCFANTKGISKVYCYAKNPPILGDINVFTGSGWVGMKEFHVPFGSKSLYTASGNFTMFTIIEDLNVPTLQFNSFVSPSGFTDSSMFATYGESIDIFEIYSNYLTTNSTAKAIYSVISYIDTMVLAAIPGRSYYYGQEIGGIMTYAEVTPVADYTLTWTTRLKKHVIVKDINVAVDIIFPTQAVWCYVGFNVKNIIGINIANFNKYIHYHDLSQMTGLSAFGYSWSFVGDMTIPDRVTVMNGYIGLGSTYLNGKLTIPPSVQSFSVGYILAQSYFTSISIPISNYFSTDGISIMSKNGKVFYGLPTYKTGSYTIPSTVTSLNSYSLLESKLSELILPDTLEIFGYRSVDGMVNLLSFTVPLSMTNLSDNGVLFRAANALKIVNLHKNVLNIVADGFSSTVINYIKADMLIPTLNSGFNATVKANAKLYVPSESVPLYRSHSDWGQFNHANINDGEVVAFDKFISNPNFNDPDDYATYGETVNIYNKYWNYYQTNPNAKYAYTVAAASAPITLSVLTGVSYRWGETISGTDYVYDVASGTAFTVGSTNRYVIYNDVSTDPIKARLLLGGSWMYCGYLINNILIDGYGVLNCVHFANLKTLVYSDQFTAFYSGGRTVYLPSTYIGPFNTWNGYLLSDVNVDPTNLFFTVNNHILYDSATTFMYFAPARTYGDLVIPSSVRNLNGFAIYGSTITTLTFLGQIDFLGIDSITPYSPPSSINFNQLLPPGGASSFYYVPNTCVIHIKQGANIADWRAIPQFNFFTTILADL